MTIVILIAVVIAYVAFHAGHSHANYRHVRAPGKRGVTLYWSSVRGPWNLYPWPVRHEDRPPPVSAVILAVVLAVVAAGTGAGLAEVCYPDLVCQRCGSIMPGADHECSERRTSR